MSVFLGKDTLVERPLTTKELLQLTDVREDWGATLIETVLKWDEGCSPPLQMIAEFVLSTWEWLMKITTMTMPEKKKVESVFDWGRLQHPRLDVSVPGYPGGSLERAVYYGWVWEPKDAFDVTVATHSDDAEVNLSLWNVGGDGPGMEEARKAIRGGLHSFWWHRLTIEASQWYQAEKTDDEEQNK